MKTLKFVSAAAICSVVLFSACKKDHEKSTSEKLEGKWSFQKEYYHSNYSGVETRDTTIGPATDYIEFRNDGKLYTKTGSNMDTLAYSVLGSDKVVTTYTDLGTVMHDTATIQKLTDNELQVYIKAFDPAPNFYEYTDFYTR